MLYIPELSLIPNNDGRYTLIAKTAVLSSVFKADDGIDEPPAAINPSPGAMSVELPLSLDPSASHMASSSTFVEHRIEGLELQSGNIVLAYVTLKDAILGEASIILASSREGGAAIETMTHSVVPTFSVTVTQRVTISAQECLAMTINATPAKKASSAAQQLHELGVVDDNQKRKHQGKIASLMAQRSGFINPALIDSGPNVVLASCAQSVFLNQGK